jgi:hypothetical protein
MRLGPSLVGMRQKGVRHTLSDVGAGKGIMERGLPDRGFPSKRAIMT